MAHLDPQHSKISESLAQNLPNYFNTHKETWNLFVQKAKFHVVQTFMAVFGLYKQFSIGG